MEALVKQVETLPVSDYLDQNTQWELLPEANFRKQLMDCSLKSGYLAFHSLLFDQIEERLPEKVFFATLQSMIIDCHRIRPSRNMITDLVSSLPHIMVILFHIVYT